MSVAGTRHRPHRTVAAALLLLAVLTGCSSGSDSQPAHDRSPTPARTSTTTLSGARATLTDVARVQGSPTGLATAQGDDGQPITYVVTREGRVTRRHGSDAAVELADLSDRVTLGGEGGAFDVAPTLDEKHLLISYQDASSHDLVISRLSLGPDERYPVAPSTVARIEQGGEIHNGGKLLVLPNGDLLVGVGDGGELLDVAGEARMAGSSRGRILRYSKLGVSGVRRSGPETVAFGLRNPWRFFRDPVTKTIWIGDVGQSHWEEIDRLTRLDARDPVDFGWDLTEGFSRARGLPPDDVRYPAMVTPHDATHCAIIAGPIVRDRALPHLVGTLVVGDFCSSEIRFVRIGPDGRPVQRRTLRLPEGAKPQSFSVGHTNEVYVLRTDGVVSRIDPGGSRLASDASPIGVQPLPTWSGPRSICGLTAALAAYPAMQGKPAATVRSLARDLAAALAGYRSADLPSAVAAPFARTATSLSAYLHRLEAARWRTNAPGVAFSGSELAQGEKDQIALASVEDSSCA